MQLLQTEEKEYIGQLLRQVKCYCFDTVVNVGDMIS